MTLSTHVLDATSGLPAQGMAVLLEHRADGGWAPVAEGSTDVDGRIRDLAAPVVGVHRLSFQTGRYFAVQGVSTFYPEVAITFEVVDPDAHHHVPLLLSPYAFSTYRGS